LHIIDLDPSSVTSGGWLEDTSLVEKYKISEEAYNKLDCKLLDKFLRAYHENSLFPCGIQFIMYIMEVTVQGS